MKFKHLNLQLKFITDDAKYIDTYQEKHGYSAKYGFNRNNPTFIYIGRIISLTTTNHPSNSPKALLLNTPG